MYKHLHSQHNLTIAQSNRIEFFSTIAEYVKKAPKDFPDPVNRKKRKLEVLELAPIPPPNPPTKEEIKAQKKRDHQLLNMLKMSIQPIMDQIHKKYKKLRNEVIPLHSIKYLLDEMDPNFVRPDIPQFRPFEWGYDKDGVKGLVETATDKFFYNLQTSMIEERLANGYYARPKDFLADIRTLAKDAKHIGDKERTLRTKELVTNVEVDIATIEANPIFADCENVYLRQLQRAKEKLEKEKKAAASDMFSLVRSDIPESGTPILGQINTGSRPGSLVTPINTNSNLSNGYGPDSQHGHGRNGTSVPSRAGDDVQMSGTDEQLASQEMAPPHQRSMISGTSNFSNIGTTRPNTQISQRSAFQEISHDTSPHDLINDASTTTSGKKTSEGWSTQATNGVSNQYSSSPIEKPGDSQLPDTQRDTQNTSGEEWPHSQAHALARGHQFSGQVSDSPSSQSQHSQTPAVPPFNAPPRMPFSNSRPHGFANLLNDSPLEPTSSQASSQKDIIIDEQFVDEMLTRLVEGSSGCSIEQLEQINRELMETLWKMRGEYNRNKVTGELVKVFNETITDIEEMQKVLAASQ
jgi:hypothetical protein